MRTDTAAAPWDSQAAGETDIQTITEWGDNCPVPRTEAPCGRRHHTGGAHVQFYPSPTTQQTSLNISGRNEHAEGEPRRQGLPADLPHRIGRRSSQTEGRVQVEEAWHVRGAAGRGVWPARRRTVQSRVKGHRAKSQTWAALSGAIKAVVYPCTSAVAFAQKQYTQGGRKKAGRQG
uniref:Uncharacterized protein n=1 Tax=Pipistrellus kuhlii TaxID=59472 RepID=A0A7J7X048_PIPKU|nr:hypothetical protein mPipKuh1_010768 [Pipistrellus kuhlii]